MPGPKQQYPTAPPPEKEVDKTKVDEGDTLKIRMEAAKASSPVLVVISGKPLGKSFFLTKETMLLGRDLAMDICIGDANISKRHAEFIVTVDGMSVKDIGSTNGTYVNDIKLTGSQSLNDGDLVRIGSTILKFLKEGKIENIHYGKMYDLATLDDMTGTLNKKSILEVINEEFLRSRAKNISLTLLMLDIDHFKQINDKFGHPAGDYVLKETCNLIKNKMIRQKDALGRYGGEEFALVLRETPLQIGVDVAERIRAAIEKHPYQFDSNQMPVTISIGAATLDSTSSNYEELIALADKALYDAKNQGRNRVCVR